MSFLHFIQTTSPRIAGRVHRVLDSGNAFIDSDLQLPMTSGRSTKTFFVRQNEARHLSQGDNVTFKWKTPGEPGSDPRGGVGKPEAGQIRIVTETQRHAVTDGLRRRQKLLQEVQDMASGNADSERILALLREAEDVLSDPAAAVSVALLVYKRARTIVEDEDEASARLQQLKEELLTLDQDMDELRTLRAEVLAEEQRLAPLREFAASIRFDTLDARPRNPELPSTHASLFELDQTLAPLATDFVRWTTLLALLTVAVNGRLLLLDGPVGSGKSSLADPTLTRG